MISLVIFVAGVDKTENKVCAVDNLPLGLQYVAVKLHVYFLSNGISSFFFANHNCSFGAPGWVLRSGSSPALFLPHYIHVDVDGGSGTVCDPGESFL